MPIIHNNLLFDYTYLAQLEHDGSIDDATKFPGAYTHTTEQKLLATKIP